MDQQAKKHLQEEFDASLEEKDQLTVLQRRVRYLTQGMFFKTALPTSWMLFSLHISYKVCPCVVVIAAVL